MSEPLSLSVGHLSLQGLRPSMEDEVSLIENLSFPSDSPLSLVGPVSFFGVFDGHGGTRAAQFTRDRLWPNVMRELSAGLSAEAALTAAYLKTDEEFGASANLSIDGEDGAAPGSSRSRFSDGYNGSDRGRDSSGTTAVSCLVDHGGRTLWMANAGDSRGLIVHRGGGISALTRDHKADRPDEVERIRKAGGFVVQRRVMGELAISRAIGDLDFKEKGFTFVIAEPEIERRQLTSSDAYILLACDGLFDVMTNEQVGHFLWEKALAGHSDQEIAESLVRHAIERLYTRDNVTVIVIQLKHIEGNDKFSAHPNIHESPVSPRHGKIRAEEILELTVHNEVAGGELEIAAVDVEGLSLTDSNKELPIISRANSISAVSKTVDLDQGELLEAEEVNLQQSG